MQQQMNPNVAFQPPQNQPSTNQAGGGFVVVNETPTEGRLTFPINFRETPVLGISIAKIVIGFIQLVIGIVDLFFIPFFTSVIGVPIWCGLLFMINGIIGIVAKFKRSKCMIASFFGLSIVSLFFTSLMLIGYALALAYYVTASSQVRCLRYGYGYGYGYACDYFVKRYANSYVDASIGLTAFLVVLILSELACSVAAVVFSCKAYSKCCNTCAIGDCGTCVGCCECSMAATSYQDLGAEHSQQYPMQQRPMHQGADDRFQQESNQFQNINPCSALFNIIINLGGAPSQTACIQHDPTNPNSVQVNINNAEPTSQRNDAILPTHDAQATQYQIGGHMDNTGQVASIRAPFVSHQVNSNEQRLPQMERSPYGP